MISTNKQKLEFPNVLKSWTREEELFYSEKHVCEVSIFQFSELRVSFVRFCHVKKKFLLIKSNWKDESNEQLNFEILNIIQTVTSYREILKMFAMLINWKIFYWKLVPSKSHWWFLAISKILKSNIKTFEIQIKSLENIKQSSLHFLRYFLLCFAACATFNPDSHDFLIIKENISIICETKNICFHKEDLIEKRDENKQHAGHCPKRK